MAAPGPNATPQATRQHLARSSLPQPRAPRYESLTAWRGVACLFVVVHHSVCTGYGLNFPHGAGLLTAAVSVAQRLWIGVPLFFVISGYCVTASADAARRRSLPGPKFFWRRFRRIYPPYWVWLGISAVGVWLAETLHPGFFSRIFVPNPSAMMPWQWFGNITLTETWRWHVTWGAEAELLSPAWTLCYEEQFYALVGLALIFTPRFFFHALALVTVLTGAGFLVFPWLGISTMGLFLDGKWLMFAAGVLVYYVRNFASDRARVWYCLPLVFGALCAAANPELLLLPRVNEPNQSYLGAFVFALALVGLHPWDTRLVKARAARPLLFCGEMCYSLYLVHWPVVTVVSWGVNSLRIESPLLILSLGLSACLLVSLSLSRLFHRLVERRFWNPGYATSREQG